MNFLRRHHTRTTKYNRFVRKFRHSVNWKPSIKTGKAMVKQNLNDKLKVSNAASKVRVHLRMRAFFVMRANLPLCVL